MTTLDTTQRFTTLNVSAYTAPNENYMGDGTSIVLNIHTHLTSVAGHGIVSSSSTHLTAKDAQKIIDELTDCLKELGVA